MHKKSGLDDRIGVGVAVGALWPGCRQIPQSYTFLLLPSQLNTASSASPSLQQAQCQYRRVPRL